MDASTRRKLDELRRALFDAIGRSEDARLRLAALQAEGFDLYLLVDGTSRDGLETTGAAKLDRVLHEEIERRALPGSRRLPVRVTGSDGLAAASGDGPAFRINGADVEWLRSLGIDPTRKARRRRKESGR